MDRRGLALLQGMLSVMIMTMLSSLSVDVGIFYMSKAQLQRAADAAALAAAADLQSGGTSATATLQATTYAGANLVSGQATGASATTVTFGTYQSNAFVPGGTPYTAVKVVMKRSSATGNAIPLYFGRSVGLQSVDIQATSIAHVRTRVPAYNIVGINRATFASAGVIAGINGNFVSNGNVSVGYPLGTLVGVTGDARSYSGTTTRGTLATVGGSTAALSTSLVYPSVTLPATYDNTSIAAYMDAGNNFTAVAAASIPAGTYVVNNLNLLAGLVINLQGPVTFYVQGSANIAATVNLLGNASFSAENFKVRVLPGGSVNFLANLLSPISMDMYAPDSAINIAVGVNSYSGRLIGKTLDICLPILGSFTEQTNLSDPVDPGPLLALVK